MNHKVFNVIKFSGLMFMTISTIMFYNHLFTASNNPKFFVTIYFDLFGEGRLELFFFTAVIPFIMFTIVAESYLVFKKK